jgi:hypothetical protein
MKLAKIRLHNQSPIDNKLTDSAKSDEIKNHLGRAIAVSLSSLKPSQYASLCN